MAAGKDYYDVLGITKGASDEEVKKAYRQLAREHHPDMVSESDKTVAEKRFKEINEAYQVLSDPQKRKMYDQYGHSGMNFNQAGSDPFTGGASGGWGPFTYSYSTSGANDFDPFDIFESFFGFRGFSGRNSPKKGKNLYYELHVEFKDAIFGLEKSVNVESGKISVKIPAGVHDGTEIRFAGKGMPGDKGAPNGDLFLTIRYSVPAQFRILGEHLVTSQEIDISQAVLGDVVEVSVVDPGEKSGVGKAKLKIPPGTQYGTQFRIKGKGFPRLKQSSQGDVIVQVVVKVPKSLNRKQRQILEEYRKTLRD